MRARIPLLAALAGAALLAAAPLAAPPAPAGTVTFLAGDATRSAGGSTEKLAVGSAVRAGDVLETQRRTRLEVKLADQSLLRLGPVSRAVVETAAFGRTVEDRKVSAKLLVGKVWANVAKAVGGEARFEVQTENAVAGVRGTAGRRGAGGSSALSAGHRTSVGAREGSSAQRSSATSSKWRVSASSSTRRPRPG